MEINTFDYKNINEKLYEYKHESGLRAFVIQKPEYNKIYATYVEKDKELSIIGITKDI